MIRFLRKHPYMFGGIVSLLIILGATIVLAYRIYQNTVAETKTIQGLRQVQMVHNAVGRIEFYLQHLAKDMHMLATLPHAAGLQAPSFEENIEHFFRKANPIAVSGFFVVDENGTLVYATGDSVLNGFTDFVGRQLHEYKTSNPTDSVWISPVTRLETATASKLYFTILVPILQAGKGNSSGYSWYEFAGFLGCLVDFNAIMHRFIEQIRFADTGFAWVMDGEGRLLFHPRHPEMILRSIFAPKSDCKRCHTSFEKQIYFLNNHAEYQEFQVGSEKPKIIAKASLNVFNIHWAIAASVDRAEIVSAVGKKYGVFLWLIGLSMLSILTAGVFLLHMNIKRVQAEEYSRYCEEKNRLQEQINHATKLASIGELVDSVAHEINTPAGIISAQVDVLRLNKEKLPYQENLDVIKDQTRRIANYTRSLLRFSRGMHFNPRPVNFPALVEECLMLLGHRLRAGHVRVLKDWPAGLPKVVVDRDQMQQVIINLLNNALDVLPERGEIILRLRMKKDEKSQTGLELLICDSGPGIRPENLSRIFEPFFSTKPPEKGTGLGLSISQAIIHRHGGSIMAESGDGTGTTFRIFLPQQHREKKNGGNTNR